MLKDIDVDEISIVDRPANMRKFLLFKQQEVKEGMTPEELQTKLEEANAKIAKLEEELAAAKAAGEKKVEEPVAKRDLSEDKLMEDVSETVTIFKEGRVLSRKNLNLLKQAIDSLSEIAKLMESNVEKEEINKQFDDLPKEEQDKVLKALNELDAKLESKLKK